MRKISDPGNSVCQEGQFSGHSQDEKRDLWIVGIFLGALSDDSPLVEEQARYLQQWSEPRPPLQPTACTGYWE